MTTYRKYAMGVECLVVPAIRVVFFQEPSGVAPAWKWLQKLNATQPRAYDKCRAAIGRLAAYGHELHRPEADYLGDGIYELRVRLGSVNYRLLYFFHGRAVSVVAAGLTKEATVPAVEINRAIVRKAAFVADPIAHTFRSPIDHA